MATHAIERGETAYSLTTAVSDATGPVTGLTVERSIYDPVQDSFLQWADGTWGPSEDFQTCIEVLEGRYRTGVIDVSLADAATEELIAKARVTAGASGVGLETTDTLRFVTSVKDIPGDVWRANVAALSASGNAAEALLAAGGALTPAAIAQEVVDQVLAAQVDGYENNTGSVGQVLFNIDSDVLKALLRAALGKMTRFGFAYLAWPTQDLFAGDIGDAFVRPILQNGELADLTGASIAWRFIALDDGELLTRVGAISGTPGHAEYITVAGDTADLTLAARNWRAYATATLPGGEVLTSERMLVKVKAVA